MTPKTMYDPPKRDRCPACLRKRKLAGAIALGIVALSGLAVGDVSGLASLLGLLP